MMNKLLACTVAASFCITILLFFVFDIKTKTAEESEVLSCSNNLLCLRACSENQNDNSTALESTTEVTNFSNMVEVLLENPCKNIKFLISDEWEIWLLNAGLNECECRNSERTKKYSTLFRSIPFFVKRTNCLETYESNITETRTDLTWSLMICDDSPHYTSLTIISIKFYYSYLIIS